MFNITDSRQLWSETLPRKMNRFKLFVLHYVTLMLVVKKYDLLMI